MNALKEYKFWSENIYFDKETRKELKEIHDIPSEIEDRFYQELEFGTGGLRGIMGAGTNRMNIYTVRKASQGLANYLLAKDKKAKGKGIVIAYDSRYKSKDFAFEAAKVFAGNGIKAYIFDELRPTPELSFAVRYKEACAGIVITASHNPKEYNGYKVYGNDGGQLALDDACKIINEIKHITDWTSIRVLEKDEAIKIGLIELMGREMDDAYISRVKGLCINLDIIAAVADSYKIVYTPLHGAGNKLVRRILSETGFKNVIVVKQQEAPDPGFSTVKSPNPEDKECFALAIELAKNTDADLIIGTDPDCDRIGVLVRMPCGDFTTLTGNQIGLILMQYILSQRMAKGTLWSNGFVVKTIVTTQAANNIARFFNVEMIEVLTGFKFIGEQIKNLDELGSKRFLFGFEESNGYLAGTFVRDKDGVIASMLIAEAAIYYHSKGINLFEELQEIYKKYGYTAEGLTSFLHTGKNGITKIEYIMGKLREMKQRNIEGSEILVIRDYLSGKEYDAVSHKVRRLVLPKSDVLYFELNEHAWCCIRPSGTEPKLKIYSGAAGINMEQADENLHVLQYNVMAFINRILANYESI